VALTPGTRLGVYEVTAQIGEGGMGQVYRATDTRLKRQVAIKILPPTVAADHDRLARFQREAEVLASLNHPNVAHIYGLDRQEGRDGQDGTSFIVMELVDGDDLSQRIAHGGIPIDEALPIAKQIAEALEAAHEQGIIHRDLKPANVKVRSDGTVKVLDFGLAKAREAGGAGQNASMSPTMMSPAQLSGVGTILGTAAYMAPEQARGKAVDKRADIWAFGVVLFEMLTGTRLFASESVPETLGLIFSREPDLSALPAATPPRVRAMIARCLVKDPRQRLRDIGDARLELAGAFETGAPADRAAIPASHPSTSSVRPEFVEKRTSNSIRALPWIIAGAAMLVAGWTVWGRTGAATTARGVMQLDIGFPLDVEPYQNWAPAISPDGQTVAMVGVKNGVRTLFTRRLDRAEVSEVPGTVSASLVAFSPDSGGLAFISGRSVTRVGLADQQRKAVTDGSDANGGLAWSSAGIIFNRGGAVWIVSPDGGAARALTVLDTARHEVAHDHPIVLPGERFVLFASQTAEPGAERIEAVPIDGGQRTVVVERATTPVWSPTGHLLFARDGGVLASVMDPRTATLRGAAIPVLPSRSLEALASGDLAFSLSSTGTLLSQPAGFTDSRVYSVGRDGAARAFDQLPPDRYANPRISPDGRRLMVEIGGQVLEAIDLARGTRARLTAGALYTTFSSWSADGSRVVFNRFNAPFWAAADGSGKAGPVPGAAINDFPSSPGPDPDSIVIVRLQRETSADVFLMSLSGAFEPKPLIVSPAYDGGAQLSPDGHWLLYQSDASGRAEIYVRRYPALDRPWQVSEGGGLQARWSRNSREIHYRSGKQIVAVALDASGAEPAFGKPTPLFADDYVFGGGASIANYDVTPDGRFIMIRRGANGGKLRVVVNWTEELKQILAAGGVR